MSENRTFVVDRLSARVYRTRAEMGTAAGGEVAERLRGILSSKPKAAIIFAAAPSQQETLDELARAGGVDWKRVVAFHMDEYRGLADGAPQGFGLWLKKAIFDKVRPGEVHYLDGKADPAAECARYSALLKRQPIDVCCMGIGENGHLAFNDPPVADFNDRALVKVVELETACRQQQVNDGCFPSIGAVPTHALTLTIPALLSAARVFCMVPGPRKAAAVKRTLQGPIATECPATALRNHPDATLYLDEDAATLADTALAR